MDTFIQISREEYLELSGNIPPVQKQEFITYEELANPTANCTFSKPSTVVI